MRDINWDNHNKNKYTKVQGCAEVLSSDPFKHLRQVYPSLHEDTGERWAGIFCEIDWGHMNSLRISEKGECGLKLQTYIRKSLTPKCKHCSMA